MSSKYNVNLTISRYYPGLRVEDHSDKETYRILIFAPEGQFFTRTQEHVCDVTYVKEDCDNKKWRAWQSAVDVMNWLSAYTILGDRPYLTRCDDPQANCSCTR